MSKIIEKINKKKPTWNESFFVDAWWWSQRSPDDETKCGAVIVKDHVVISHGYNGFLRDVDDSDFPTTRPDKYPFMIHSEHNAILNAARNGISTLSSIIYITGEPCTQCLQYMWQAGIKIIYYTDISKPIMKHRTNIKESCAKSC